MLRNRQRTLGSLLLAMAALLGSCSDNPVTDDRSGKLLELTVNGTKLTITPTAEFTTYTEATKRGEFGGTLVGTPSKTFTGSFTYDIVAGPFPMTLQDPVISMTYIEATTGNTVSYSSLGHSAAMMTITASNGSIVDGTFSGTLHNIADTSQKVTITDGKFSVKMR